MDIIFKAIAVLSLTICIGLSGYIMGAQIVAAPKLPDENTEEVAAVEKKIEFREVSKIAYYDVPLSEDLQTRIIELCEARNIDPAIVIAMIERESTFRADAMGDNGRAYGLMQIWPIFCEEKMMELGCDNLLDPYQNVTVGIDILGEYIERGKGLEWALMAYNGGPAYADRNSNAGIVSEYVENIYELKASYGVYEIIIFEEI